MIAPANSNWQPALIEGSGFPWKAMGMSALIHALLLVAASRGPLFRKKPPLIDFDHEQITYYQVSPVLPDISPLPAPLPTQYQSRHPELWKAEKNNDQAVAIHPELPQQVDQVIEQPELSAVQDLPKLALPNLLMQPAKLDQPSLPKPEKPNADPQPSLPILPPELQAPRLETNQLRQARPEIFDQEAQIPLPAKPVPLPVVQPVQLEDSEGEIQVKDLPPRETAPLLAYSLHPTLPRGELKLPKVNSSGNLKASPQAGASPVPLPASPEFGSASITIPNVSLRNRVSLPSSATGQLVVQAPAPPAPPPAEKKPEPPPTKSLRDFLPSLISPQKLPGMRDRTVTTIPDSPLTEVERQGKTIYTAAINAPNFTSKRGSWIFRFAELADLPDAKTPDGKSPASSVAALTAPSAVVKVDPRFAPEVQRDKVEGVVVLYAIIRKDGTVDPQSIRLLQKLDPRLDVSARNALLEWKFKPSLKNGQPVDIQAEVTIPFYSHRDIFSK